MQKKLVVGDVVVIKTNVGKTKGFDKERRPWVITHRENGKVTVLPLSTKGALSNRVREAVKVCVDGRTRFNSLVKGELVKGTFVSFARTYELKDVAHATSFDLM